jgi:plasmid replication initiation protein
MEITAYHEAGHAVMAHYLGAQVLEISLLPEEDELPDRTGDTKIAWPTRRFSGVTFHQAAIQVALAGPVAEILYTQDPYHPGLVQEWAADWHEAVHHVQQLPKLKHAKLQAAHLEETTRELIAFLDQEPYWSAIAAISDELLAHEYLDQEQIIEALSFWFAHE